MAEPGAVSTLFSPRKIVIQVGGFIIGLALLIWCISLAVGGGDWSKIASARPALIMGLIGCSLVSQLVNGGIFWLVIRPVKRLRFDHMQWLNLVTSVLNYAPIRAGLLARVAYHLRVDRLSVLQIGAWFASVGMTLLLALGSAVAATIVRPRFDWLWVALLLGQILLGGLLIWTFVGQPIVTRFGQGMDQMLGRPANLWGALALRMVDIGAFSGRMACAVGIMQLDLAASDVLLLAFASLALSLNPLGRFGFREMAVTFVAARLVSADLLGSDLGGELAQLALIESAGEAMVAVPLGSICLLWYRQRWRRASARPSGESATDRGS